MAEYTVFCARKKIGVQKLESPVNRLNSIQFHFVRTPIVNGKRSQILSKLECTLV